MLEVEGILAQVANTDSRNEKMAILLQNQENTLLQKVLNYTYCPYKTYGFGKKSLEGVDSLGMDMVQSRFVNIFELLDYLVTVNTNNQVKSEVLQFLAATPPKLRDLYVRMVLKDVRAGITENTVNKVWKGLVPQFKIMLAKKLEDHEDKIKDFIATIKLDGSRAVIIKDNGNTTFKTRQNKLIEDCVELLEETERLPDNMVYDGELLMINTDNLPSDELFRKTREIVGKKGEKRNLEFHCFDMLPLEEFKNGKSKKDCLDRKKDIVKIIAGGDFKLIKDVPMLYVGSDKNKITELLDEAVKNNHEGIMVNTLDGKYECKRSSEILKVKRFFTADVLVLDIIEGEGRNEGRLGAITIQFEHEGELHTCNCGTGFSDQERILYYEQPELLLGKIVEIGYFEISKNADGETSLRFPSWKSNVRHDKTEISMY